MLRSFTLFIITLSLSGALHAQQDKLASSLLWKKRVSRLIDMRDTLDVKGRIHKNDFADTSITKLLIDAVMKQEIVAYEHYYTHFEDKIDLSRLNLLIHPELDTLDKSIHHAPFVYSRLYRIIEDWVYYPLKRETEIQIVGVIPLHEIYGDDSVYRVHSGIFLIKWNDFVNFYEKYSNIYPENNFLKSFWDDYFKYPCLYIDTQSAQPRCSKKILSKTALRDIDIIDTDYSENPHFYEENDAGNLFTAFFDPIHKKKIIAYSDRGERFSHTLSSNDVDFWTTVDSVEIVNPITGEKEMKITHYDFNPDWFHKYTILESWSFNLLEGKATIHILGIEPRLDQTGLKFIGYHNLFWVRYNDILDILQSYDEYHPINNLSTALWQGYFKPHAAK